LGFLWTKHRRASFFYQFTPMHAFVYNGIVDRADIPQEKGLRRIIEAGCVSLPEGNVVKFSYTELSCAQLVLII